MGHRHRPLCPNTLRRVGTKLLVFLLAVSIFPFTPFHLAQAQQSPEAEKSQAAEIFKLERVPVEGGAELITIHAKLSGLASAGNNDWVPMVTVLRDTLGDVTPENDRLRYVWPLTYTRPTTKQRISGAIPFLYTRVGNKNGKVESAPPPVLDLAAPDRDVWNRIFWTALQSLLLDPYGMPVKASTRSYRRNISDYRKSHIIRALSILSLYQSLDGPPPFSESEMAQIQARLMLTDKTFGGIVDSLRLEGYYEKQTRGAEDIRGHNWELLRQRAEAESLIFEPLQMPDGSATHAILWVSKKQLSARQGKPYEKRFLNIDDPWSDGRLRNWKGYIETRYVDAENRFVPQGSPGAESIELIPLALYGLDFPKIPALLVDFRDGLNPKKREMSRRVLQDVTRNVLSLSKFGDVPYFLGRTVFDFVTGRRGMDVNQPSRLRTYAQLKLLLSLDQSLDPELREEMNTRLEKVSLNPLENDLDTEARVARQQYAALLNYANSPKGLAAKLDRDRRQEMVPFEHGKVERILFRLGNVLTFGKYVHREKATPDYEARLDVARRLKYHTEFLREVAQSGPRVDVVWSLDEIKRSLRYLSDHGAEADSRAVAATAKIFGRTDDDETRRMCLDSLSRMNNPKAKKELIRISQDSRVDQRWKDLIVALLNKTVPGEPMSASTGTPAALQPEQH